MSDAAKIHDAAYSAFASRMLAALATEEASIAKYNGKFAASTVETNAATVRPSK